MNKAAIKKFAIKSHQKLVKSTIERLEELGIADGKIIELVELDGVYTVKTQTLTEHQKKNRDIIIQNIQEKGYKPFVEEIAYMWFNRIIAIHYIEVNDYSPFKTRVLSSEILSNEINDYIEELELNRDKVIELKEHNKQEELFKYVFIKVCNYLGQFLPVMFEQIEDYTELLLPSVMIANGSVIKDMIDLVPEEDWVDQVEIIGWLYQYYNEERKNEVINVYKGTVKKEDIPAATQLFTTDWVVRYMVDNSLGRYWIERHPESTLKDKLDFFVTPKNGEIKIIDEEIEPKDLTFFDPCMGSGHILVYAFDVLMHIYTEYGYSEREAAVSILENNLFGLDIDDRVYQLAYFSIMMKARSYDRRILTMNLSLVNLASIQETNDIDSTSLEEVILGTEYYPIAQYLLDIFKDAKEIGSLLKIKNDDYNQFIAYLSEYKTSRLFDLSSGDLVNRMLPLVINLAKQANILSNKYKVVCTNPPYLGKMEGELKKFVTKYYKNYSGDLFSIFMYRNFDFIIENGYSGFMTPFVWMFIKKYEKLRQYIIDNKSITTLVQMEYSAFEEATVPICSFVLKNGIEVEKGYYFKLSEFKGGMDIQKQKVLEALSDRNCGYYYEADTLNYKKIPNSPIAFSVNDSIFSLYDNSTHISDIGETREGMATANNDYFLKYWYEVGIDKIGFGCLSRESAQLSRKKWFPYNKGGDFRKWFGNDEYVVNWENDGYEIQNFRDEKTGRIRSHNYNLDYIFKKGITWTALSSGNFGCRYSEEGKLADSKGSMLYLNNDTYLKYILALLNSKVSAYILGITSQTLDFKPGRISEIPVIIDRLEEINALIGITLSLSKYDWDSFETSWGFTKHSLIQTASKMSEVFMKWSNEASFRFEKLKDIEEEINRIFIDIYALGEELTSEVEEKDVTIRKADRDRDIKSFISYAVGCMMGRYSLDEEGLIFAGGELDESKYQTFKADEDGIILISDTEYFEDDLLNRFVEFVKVVYGEETLEENLNFIADTECFKRKSTESARDCLHRYFLKGFMEDHLKVYQNRPIYWMFDSGKQNGFKALIYMHRYNEDMVAKVRTDYLHPLQRKYEAELERLDHLINFDNISAAEKGKVKKRQKQIHKQLDECTQYDLLLAHVAHKRIPLDLDDGVKVNYQKFQNFELTTDSSSKSKKGNLLYKAEI